MVAVVGEFSDFDTSIIEGSTNVSNIKLAAMSSETKFVLTSIYLFSYSLFNSTVGSASPNTDIC